MVIYFFLRDRDDALASSLAAFLRSKDHEVSCFFVLEDLYTAIMERGGDDVGFVAVDIRSFEYDKTNPYQMCRRFSCILPVIVYNDPYPDPDCMVSHWTRKLDEYMGPQITQGRKETLVPVWEDIQAFLLKSGFCRAPRTVARMDCAQMIEYVRGMKLLPLSRFRLFEYMCGRLGEDVDADELCMELWGEWSESRRRMLYAYVHDVRAVLRKESSLGLDLRREGRGVYRLTCK